jgi:hypothetical protein
MMIIQSKTLVHLNIQNLNFVSKSSALGIGIVSRSPSFEVYNFFLRILMLIAHGLVYNVKDESTIQSELQIECIIILADLFSPRSKEYLSVGDSEMGRPKA